MGHESRQNPMAQGVAGPPIVRDSVGRPMTEGDEIFLHGPYPPRYRITSIRTDVSLDLPANVLIVDIVATGRFLCVRGAVNKEFTRVRTAEEAGPFKVEVPFTSPKEVEP